MAPSLGTARGWAKPLHARRPAVDTQAAIRNSSLRGSIPKAPWRGVRPTPLKTPRSCRPLGPHTFESPWTFKSGLPQKCGGRSRVPCKLTRRAHQKFGVRSRVPFLGRRRKADDFATQDRVALPRGLYLVKGGWRKVGPCPKGETPGPPQPRGIDSSRL